MLCHSCHEKPATIFLTVVVHRKRTDRNLCKSCAETSGPLLPVGWTPGIAPPPLAPEFMQSLMQRPTEVAVTDPVTVRALAEALRVPPFKVISLLMRHQIFLSADRNINFETASLVCAHFGVTAKNVSC